MGVDADDLCRQIDDYRLQLFRRGDDPTDFDVKDFLESHAKITDTAGNRINLIFNKAQAIVHDTRLELLDINEIVRLLILKIRQLGISTYISALFIALAYHIANITLMQLAHIWDSSDWIYGISRGIYHHLPSHVKSQRALTGIEPTQSGIRFALPHGSQLLVGTAGNIKLGHSMTLQKFHGSEVARWPNAMELMKGVGNAIHYVPGTESYLETTAEGEDPFFYPLYKAAKDGENEWRALFLGLKEFGSYHVVPEQYRNRPKEEWRPDEVKFQIDSECSDELMDFVIYRKRSEACSDNWPHFNGQYPWNEDVAFSESGRNVFNLEALDAMMVEDVRDPIRRGDFVYDCDEPGSAVSLREDVQLPLWEIYEEPDYDADYILTADIAEGSGSDYGVGHIWRIDGKILFQTAHCYSNWIETWFFGLSLFQGGTFFNCAYAAIESNNQGLLVVKNFEKGFAGYPQTDGGYPNLYYPIRYQSKDDTGLDKLGWLTNSATKPILVADLQKTISDREIVIRCKRTISELRGFYWDAERKRYTMRHKHSDAKGYHDDEVMSTGIAPQALKEWKRRPRLLPRPKGWHL